MKINRRQLAGIVLFAGFSFIGFFGAFFGVYSSFAALEGAESAGIGAVGDGIRNALVSTVIGLAGSIVGVVLFVVGTVKRDRIKHSE